jgi:hypothetical protein
MNATDYLEAAKIEEIASQLRGQGFEVRTGDADTGYDLIATRAGERIAMQVKARSELGDSADQIARLREQARRDGYDFRLVVVNPPRERAVEVEGLMQRLDEYLTENPPPELERLSSHTRMSGVSDLEIDSLEVTREGVHVTGNGVVDVELEYSGGEAKDGVTSGADFPFSFDVLLDQELHIRRVNTLTVDTSSFYE